MSTRQVLIRLGLFFFVAALLSAGYAWLINPYTPPTPLIAVNLPLYPLAEGPNPFGQEDFDSLEKVAGQYRTMRLIDVASAGVNVDSSRQDPWLVGLEENLLHCPGGGPDERTIMVYWNGQGYSDTSGKPILLIPRRDNAAIVNEIDANQLLEVLARVSTQRRREGLRLVVLLDVQKQLLDLNRGLVGNGFAGALRKQCETYQQQAKDDHSGLENVVILAAADSGEVNLALPERFGSAFGVHLAGVLSGDPRLDSSGDRVIDWAEFTGGLHALVASEAKSRGAEQHPCLIWPTDDTKASFSGPVLALGRGRSKAGSTEPEKFERPRAWDTAIDLRKQLESLASNDGESTTPWRFAPVEWAHAQVRLLQYQRPAFAGRAYEAQRSDLQRDLTDQIQRLELAKGRLSRPSARISWLGEASRTSQRGKSIALSAASRRRIPEEAKMREASKALRAFLAPPPSTPAQPSPPAAPAANGDVAVDSRARLPENPEPENRDRENKPPAEPIKLSDEAAVVAVLNWAGSSAETPPLSKDTLNRALNFIEQHAAAYISSREVQWLRLLEEQLDWSECDAEMTQQVHASIRTHRELEEAAAVRDPRIWDTIRDDLTLAFEHWRREADRMLAMQRDVSFTTLSENCRSIEERSRQGEVELDERDQHLSDATWVAVIDAAENGRISDQLVPNTSLPYDASFHNASAERLVNYFEKAKYLLDQSGERSDRLARIEQVVAIPPLAAAGDSDEFGSRLLASYCRILEGVAAKNISPTGQPTAVLSDIQNATDSYRVIPWSSVLDLDEVITFANIDQADREIRLHAWRLIDEPGAGNGFDLRSIPGDALCAAQATLLIDHAKIAYDDFWGPRSDPYFARAATSCNEEALGMVQRLESRGIDPSLPIARIQKLQTALEMRRAHIVQPLAPPESLTRPPREFAEATAEIPFPGFADGLRSSISGLPGSPVVEVRLVGAKDVLSLTGAHGPRGGARHLRIDSFRDLVEKAHPPLEIAAGGSLEFATWEQVVRCRGHEWTAPVASQGTPWFTSAYRSPTDRTARILVRTPATSVATILFVLDCSSSMSSDLPPCATRPRETRFDAARRSLISAIKKVPDGSARIALVALGHRAGWRRDGTIVRRPTAPPDLHPNVDVEILVPLGDPIDDAARQRITAELVRLRPTGQTPLYFALETALKHLTGHAGDGPRRVVVLSDGSNDQPLQDGPLDAIRESIGDISSELQRAARVHFAFVGAAQAVPAEPTSWTSQLSRNGDELESNVSEFHANLLPQRFVVRRNGDAASSETLFSEQWTGDIGGDLPTTYDVRVQDSDAAPLNVSLLPGTEIELEYDRRGRRLAGTSQGKVRVEGELRPAVAIHRFQNSEYRLAAFAPREVADGSTNVFRFQLRSATRDSLRADPVRMWVAIEPEAARDSTPYPPYLFAECEPAPQSGPLVFRFSAENWPRDARSATVLAWIHPVVKGMNSPGRLLALDKPRGEQELDTGAVLSWKTGASGGQWIVHTHPAPRSTAATRIFVWCDDAPSSVLRHHNLAGDSVWNVFTFDGSGPDSLRWSTFDDLDKQAIRLTSPIRVTLTTE